VVAGQKPERRERYLASIHSDLIKGVVRQEGSFVVTILSIFVHFVN
jgi:hypothetical protein